MVQARDVMAPNTPGGRPSRGDPALPAVSAAGISAEDQVRAGESQREISTHQSDRLEYEKGVTYCDLEANDVSPSRSKDGVDGGNGTVDPSIPCITTKDGF